MATFLTLAAAEETAGGGLIIIVYLALIVLVIAGMWKAFVKAGRQGWEAIIPFYNAYVMCLIAGRPGWWFILFLVPIVSIVVAIIVSLDIATKFGKGAGFGIGLALLGFIFWPILGFGDAEYQG